MSQIGSPGTDLELDAAPLVPLEILKSCKTQGRLHLAAIRWFVLARAVQLPGQVNCASHRGRERTAAEATPMLELLPTFHRRSPFSVVLYARGGESFAFAAKKAFTTEGTESYREKLTPNPPAQFAEDARPAARPRAQELSARPRWLVRRTSLAYRAVLLAASLLLPGAYRSEAQTPTEYQVKAAYIFNFLKFVEWPGDAPDAGGKWIVGVVGDSPVGEELTRLSEGKEVLGRSLQIKRLQGAESFRDCNILFISPSERKRWPSILSALRGSSVLTVADMEDFVGSGGMVQLLVEDTRVRMVIDVSATNRAKLKVSSKMLLLARVV